MDMHDMGSKDSMGTEVAQPSEKKVRYPNLTLNTMQFPEAKTWEVGKKYHLHLIVEQKGIAEDYDNKDEYRAKFDVLKAESIKGGTVSDEEYGKMSNDEKDNADEKEVLGDEE